MPPAISLGAVSIDCPDPLALSAFYRDVTGWTVAFESDTFVALSGPSVWLTLQKVDDYRSPTWPAPDVPKQLHLDFAVSDLDAAEAGVLAAVATRADEQPNPGVWRVYLDPVGHPFCLTTLIPDPD